MYQVALTAKAEKELDALTARDHKRILEALQLLAFDPFEGKKLKGIFLGYYSLRVWPLRIIYAIDKPAKTVYILRIGQRQNIYK